LGGFWVELVFRECPFLSEALRQQALPGVNAPRPREGSVHSPEIAVSEKI